MDEMAARQGLTRDEAAAFLGKNEGYYLEKWSFNPGRPYKGWNFAATFFPLEWMAYRRLYLEALCYFAMLLAASLALGLLLALVGLGGFPLARTLSDGARIFVGAFANSYYRKKAVRCVRKTGGMGADARLAFMRQKGGTSVVGVIACVLLQLGYLALTIFL